MSINPIVHTFILQSVLRGERVLNLRILLIVILLSRILSVSPSLSLSGSSLSRSLSRSLPLRFSPCPSLLILLGLVRLLIVPSHPLEFSLFLFISPLFGFGLTDHLRSPPPSPSQFIINDSTYSSHLSPIHPPPILSSDPTALEYPQLYITSHCIKAALLQLPLVVDWARKSVCSGHNPCWLPYSRLGLSSIIAPSTYFQATY